MRFQPLALSLAALAAPTLGQTPERVVPSTSNRLPVKYGSIVVTPGIMLPERLTASFPTITYSGTPNTTYMVFLIDFSVPGSIINASIPGIKAPGLGPDRYTRLHYWQTDLELSANGTLVNKTAPIASYQGPAPRQGDSPHTYIFFLFPQTRNFVPPAAGTRFSAGTVDQGSNRLNFDIFEFSKQGGVGALVAGNYILVQNSTNNYY